MLQDIRDNSQGIIAKVIIGLIVAVFVLFGAESIVGGFITPQTVMEVNGEEITVFDLQNSTQSVLNILGEDPEDMDPVELESLALGQLVRSALLRQNADSAALSISSDAIDRSLVNSEQFQINGIFNNDLAIRTMEAMGYTTSRYRQEIREQLLFNQIVRAYSDSNFVINSELESLAEMFDQSRDFRYLSVILGNRTEDTPITETEIDAYYQANPDEFSEPETVVVDYVLLSQAAILDEITVDEADIQASYEDERIEFEESAEKRAAHILFETGAAMSETEALAAATAAAARLAAGEAFATLAQELSSDTISAEQGGDIGYTDGTAFPPELELALESLELDAVSEPVITEFGVHLVKLTEVDDDPFPPYEEIRDRIEQDAKASEVELIFTERLEDMSNLAFENYDDLETISEQLDLEIQQSEAFDRNGGIGPFANPDVLTAAWSEAVQAGDNSEVVDISDSEAIVLRQRETTPARLLSLEEVSAEITVLLRSQMERAAVQNIGNEIFGLLISGAASDEERLNTLLTENELEWIEHTGLKRDSDEVNADILATTFIMPHPTAEGAPNYDYVTLANGTFAIVELNTVTPGSLDEIEEDQLIGLTQQIQRDLGENDFNAYLTRLERTADIRRITQPTLPQDIPATP
ncbi:MAG: SurA N-terminal domain-containing protein [Pseudohongiellaceae bacterium]